MEGQQPLGQEPVSSSRGSDARPLGSGAETSWAPFILRRAEDAPGKAPAPFPV